ncbi:MAG: hypothetical protein ABL973_00190 [Micropepsaceae bacterium]
MGSFLLFIIGVAAPLAVAVAVMWSEDYRRSYLRMKFERMAQDNRGLKLAVGSSKAAQNELPAQSEAERKEIQELATKLAQGGILLEWLRLGTKAPEEAAARLLGVNAQEAGQLQGAVAEWGANGIIAVLDRVKERLASISEMEMVWADPHNMLERDLNSMAERALWVFEPEYVVNAGDFDVDARLGAVAKPSVSAGLHNGSSKEGDPTLVVELKGARVTVGGEQQMQAWNNVRDLMRNGTIRERDPVDVFVIGGSVDEYEGNPRLEGRHRNVRITSYDYGQLIARAKRLTFGLYDDLKDTAPFIRQHRDEIAEAQQAAVNAAAAEASAPAHAHAEEDDLVRDSESETDSVRDVEYADDARPEDEEPVPQKDAAQ